MNLERERRETTSNNIRFDRYGNKFEKKTKIRKQLLRANRYRVFLKIKQKFGNNSYETIKVL